MEKINDAYMQVEPVLKWLNKQKLSLKQYTLIQNGKAIKGTFFKCSDLAKKLNKDLFRKMECDVCQYLVEVEKIEKQNVTLRCRVTYTKETREAKMERVLKRIVETFPEMDTDEEMSGSETISALCEIWPEIKEALK